MGVDFAKAALAAGNAVVATGRNTEAVRAAVGEAEDLLVVQLDVTSPEDAEAAVKAAVDRFGRIDVLVNNAANFYGGYFEELTPGQIEDQLATGLIGPMNVTRAVLPVMRKQRSGTSCRHRRARAFLVLSSIPLTPPRSSAWRGGWSRSSPRSSRSASPPPSSTPGSSGPIC
jgi:NAD(P)-dependent dehydrogenase (short-subunit alcohol dehydrogenase family)